MTIYDVKFYGVYFRYKAEFSGVTMYETLESPFIYLEDDVWRKSHNTAVTDAFMKLYISMRLNNN